MSGVPVVIVPSGGIPITQVESGAPLLESVQSGGVAVTLTDNAAPFVLFGIPPNPPAPMGALDYYNSAQNAFTNFSQNFDLSADAAVLGLVCHFDGDPQIEIAHGGEPLTILSQAREGPILSLIAVGTGLTVESAPLTVIATGGNLHGGSIRINEMINVSPELVGWTGTAQATAKSATVGPVSGADGGVTKIAVASSVNGSGGLPTISGATALWTGYVYSGGDLPGLDVGPDGPWTLGDGWKWVGDKLIHSGSVRSSATLDIPTITPTVSSSAGGADRAIIAAGASCTVNSVSTGSTRRGPYDAPLFQPVSGTIEQFSFTATGDVELSDISIRINGTGVSWIFASAPTSNGDTYTATSFARGPHWAVSAAEALGEDHD